jgi:hypothetical protein
MHPDPSRERTARAMCKDEEIARWAFAVLAAGSAFAIGVEVRGLLYKGGEPDELLVWAISTVAGVIVGTVCAPRGGKDSVDLFIGLAVSASMGMLLGSVAAQHSLDATDVKRVIAAAVGGIAARIILRRA